MNNIIPYIVIIALGGGIVFLLVRFFKTTPASESPTPEQVSTQTPALKEGETPINSTHENQPKAHAEDVSGPRIVKLTYEGSGVRFLRFAGWMFLVLFAVAVFVGAWIFGSILSAILVLPTFILFAGICFALATIAENALISTAILKEKYKIEE